MDPTTIKHKYAQ